jgi:hypothetical protein
MKRKKGPGDVLTVANVSEKFGLAAAGSADFKCLQSAKLVLPPVEMEAFRLPAHLHRQAFPALFSRLNSQPADKEIFYEFLVGWSAVVGQEARDELFYEQNLCSP